MMKTKNKPKQVEVPVKMTHISFCEWSVPSKTTRGETGASDASKSEALQGVVALELLPGRHQTDEAHGSARHAEGVP